jgi:hypothetical protein
MPKDPKKNIERYKVRGGDLNEFDFHQNQEEFAEQQQTRGANLIPGTPPEKAAKRKPAAKGAKPATKGTKPATKGTKAATKPATKSTKSIKAKKGATTKKQSTRKATKK